MKEYILTRCILFIFCTVPIIVSIWHAKVGLFWRISINDNQAKKQAAKWKWFNYLVYTGKIFVSVHEIESYVADLMKFLQYRTKRKKGCKNKTLYFVNIDDYIHTKIMIKIAILNTSILTTYGVFVYQPITLEEAKKLIAAGYQSYVGHQSTCDILTELLEVPVEMNRTQYEQKASEKAIVFKLNSRPPEGKILTKEELIEIGFSFGLVTKLP